MTLNLRDHLLAALKDLPGTRDFHLHVIISSARKHQGLFTFATPRPKTYIQDILVLLSEQASVDTPRLFVTAVEMSLYHLPSTSSAILYVSKVDTTGQSVYPSPTSTIVKSLLSFYVDPRTRPLPVANIWVHLFARAQRQYLFPNSADFSGKYPLTDVQLCGWWKRVLSAVGAVVRHSTGSHSTTKLYYILPGYSRAEAENLLKSEKREIAEHWIYGHPYSQTDIPLPCPPNTKNLGHFIPYFDDCPKARFLDELAYITETEGIKSPARKRPRTTSHSDSKDPETVLSGEKTGEKADGTSNRALGELSKVSPDEFWERMSFRQECVAGAVTGFFALGSCSPTAKGIDTLANAVSPLAPQAGQVSSQINKRIITSLMTGVEFSTMERAIRGTEAIENTIRGLCEGISPSGVQYPVHSVAHSPLVPVVSTERRMPERELIPLTSSNKYLEPPKTPPRRTGARRLTVDISPNPFPEPETSLETYNAYIYGTTHVSNPALRQATDKKQDTKPEGAPHVTVLAVRKKKKKAE